MQLLSKKQKQSTYGGASTSTLMWVGLVGAGLILSAINTFVQTMINATSSSSSKSSSKTYSSYTRSSAMIRMSAIPSRSAVNFWV